MLSNKIFLYLTILVPTICFSQDDVNTDIRNVTKANFLSPGVSYEKKVGRLQSFHAQAFLSTAISIGYSSAIGNTSSIDFYPGLALQYRYYYNAVKRKAKDKRTEMNSLNYVGPLINTTLHREYVSRDGDKKLRALKVFGATWGLQRNYQNRFALDINVGLGYLVGKETTITDTWEYITQDIRRITNPVQINLGFWLNRRN